MVCHHHLLWQVPKWKDDGKRLLCDQTVPCLDLPDYYVLLWKILFLSVYLKFRFWCQVFTILRGCVVTLACPWRCPSWRLGSDKPNIGYSSQKGVEIMERVGLGGWAFSGAMVVLLGGWKRKEEDVLRTYMECLCVEEPWW